MTSGLCDRDGVQFTDESILLTRLRAGDESAFEHLVRTETKHLLAVARRLLQDEEDSRDAVQQAFLLAFRALPSFNGQSRLTTWLHRIVTNEALMKLRARTRRPERSIEDLLPEFLEDGHHVEHFSEWSLPPEASLMRGETRAQVRAAIDQLPGQYRTVLLMRDIDDLSTEETARLLGVTPNAVKVRLHRARQALVKLLDPVFDPAAAGQSLRRR
jgi:RNA polymerase sigma-70 factor (ECF subfamily)